MRAQILGDTRRETDFISRPISAHRVAKEGDLHRCLEGADAARLIAFPVGLFGMGRILKWPIGVWVTS